MPADYVLGNVRAVLRDTVIDDARVVVRDGRIADIGTRPAGASADIDGGGLFCMPGVIDVHSDALERERVPRPSAYLPWDFAVASLEAKLRAAGITTVFHGAGFQEKKADGFQRSASTAFDLCGAIAARAAATAPLVDHRVLYRLDARSAEGAHALAEVLGGQPAAQPLPAQECLPLVSHEDHTPGQGQYADRRHLERYVAGSSGLTDEQAARHVDEMIADRDSRLPVLARNLAWLGELARAGRIRLVGHDLDSPEAVDALRERGGSVAEFPTTVPTARAARDLGFPVVMGAPNVLRGESHSGNVSARELIERGLVTALASDYLPSGMLAAAFWLASDGAVTLPAAVSLVTSGPAAAAGLADRGRLADGQRADLALVDASAGWPVARAVLRAVLSVPGSDEVLAQPVGDDLDHDHHGERGDDDRAGEPVDGDLDALGQQEADAAAAHDAEDGRGPEVDVQHVHGVGG
jgi:alpha-D-ribose 1-methylphosphonate 5-triphosphate diphosphatase